MRGLGSEQVASVLRQCGVHVRMVVARPVEPTSPDYQVNYFKKKKHPLNQSGKKKFLTKPSEIK